jgi:tetraprenyl-beta-curcumene synthase
VFLGNRRLAARAGVALVLANARYWTSVVPLVRRQLQRWEQRAQAIRDPTLQALALDNLDREGFNAEVAATLATLAPPIYRAGVVEAIVALEVMYDYLDGLTEQPTPDPLRAGHALFEAFIDALDPNAPSGQDYYRHYPYPDDDGYLGDLSITVKTALARLPAAAAVIKTAERAATRCADAQIRAHAVVVTGTGQLEQWAEHEAAATTLQWREYLAGAASSVLAIHALIAAAANNRTTPEQATAIDTAYLSIAVLSTMLDSVIDYEHDAATGKQGYIRYYDDPDTLARNLASIVHHTVTHAKTLPNAAHHIMTLVGVVAYYTSAPTTTREPARHVATHIQRELSPLIMPTLAVMHTWRLAKEIRLRRYNKPSATNKQPA